MPHLQSDLSRRTAVFCLTLIIVMGAVLRFAHLQRPLIGSDEPQHILASTTLLNAPLLPPDITLSGLHETFIGQLFTYRHGFVTQLIPFLAYVVLSYAGVTLNETAFHLPVVVLGTLCLPLLFFLTYELTERIDVSVLSTGLLAVYPLHVMHSRSFHGNHIFATFFSMATLLFVARWLKYDQRTDMILAVVLSCFWIGSDNLFALGVPLVLLLGLCLPSGSNRFLTPIEAQVSVSEHNLHMAVSHLLKLRARLNRILRFYASAGLWLLLPLSIIGAYVAVDSIRLVRVGLNDAGFLLRTVSKASGMGVHLSLLVGGAQPAFSPVGAGMFAVALLVHVAYTLRGGPIGFPLAWSTFLILLFALFLTNADYIDVVAAPAAIVTAEGILRLTQWSKMSRITGYLVGIAGIALVLWHTLGLLHPQHSNGWIWGQPVGDVGAKAVGYVLRTYLPQARVAAAYEGAELYWGRRYDDNLNEADVAVVWDVENLGHINTPLRANQQFIVRQETLLSEALQREMTVAATFRDRSDQPLCYLLTHEQIEISEQRIPILNRLFDQTYSRLEDFSRPKLGFP